MSAFAERWNGYAAVLSARIGAIASQDPDAVRGRAHVEEILRRVGAEPSGIEQSQLGREFNLGKANLTRILNLMEANDLIERRSLTESKRGKVVVLGAQAQPTRPSHAPESDPSDRAPRGMSFLQTG